MKTNTELQFDVVQTLDRDPRVSLEPVRVTVRDGIVTLSGEVGSFFEKMVHHQINYQEAGIPYPAHQYIAILLPVSDRDTRALPSKTAPSVADQVWGLVADSFEINLSAREIEVLSLIARGQSNQEIAKQLCLALNTVKRHAYNIYAKLDVRSRTQAVSKARRLGLIA